MGLSSAMNQMGGVIATLIAGVLAAVSWRASFLVYLLGVICIVLCLLFLPNDKFSSAGDTEDIPETASNKKPEASAPAAKVPRKRPMKSEKDILSSATIPTSSPCSC